MPDTDYSKADRFCDVVMKGGITSGLVYPAAVCRLATDYRFRSIGGTSAGAIAAAATAAAEHGRRTGKGTSFRELETLPSLLAGPRLFRLFQPQPDTANLFHTLTAGIRGRRGVLPFVLAAFKHYLPFALLGAAPVLVFFAPASSLVLFLLSSFFAAALTWIPWIVLAVVTSAVAVALAMLYDLTRKVPANGFGLCSGMGGDEALTPWLHDLLQRLSGKPKEEPLTFGDLWGDDPSRREVDLQMMTTCLTFGRPSRLPFPEGERDYLFKPAEFEKLFPKAVVDWMRSKSAGQGELLPLPAMRDLPVVVAARMSLSFPLLIGAVPLHAVDTDAGATVPEPVWFSDGGIASNFPVHFFDSPLPGWPTFAINLRYFEEKPAREVVMPETNDDGVAERFHRFQKAGLFGFFRAIFDAMQNWQDNTQARLPGFRDRVAHVCLGPGEGGLNLEMPEATVKTISARGAQAGEMLSTRFAPDSPAALDWDNHRWVRLRSTLATLEEMLEKLGPRLSPDWRPPQPGDVPYAELLKRPSPPSFPWTADQRPEALRAVEEVRTTGERWLASPPRLREGAPRPMPELRARPKL